MMASETLRNIREVFRNVRVSITTFLIAIFNFCAILGVMETHLI